MTFVVSSTYAEDISHYGVKGMKWGVRRTPEQLGHKTKESTTSKAKKVLNTPLFTTDPNKTIRFTVSKKKETGFDIPIPQVKNQKLQTAIDYGAKMIQPFMSPGGLLVGALIAPIPGLDAPVILAGMAAYERIKEQGFTATVIEAKDFTVKKANQAKEYVSNKFKHSDEFAHHGIVGQKWGKRNGPPYPLKGGDYSVTEKKKIRIKRLNPNSIYNKKHFDTVLKADETELTTLSYDKDRTKDADMFYATYKPLDKHQYNALFNKPIEEAGETVYKWRINNTLKSDIKVASEDSGAKIFADLYKEDKDFYNFVVDPDRMQKYFVDDKYKFRGYKQAKDTADKIRLGKTPPTDKDVKTLYRMFNYVIPYDGGGEDSKGAQDVAKQREKFFKEAKKEGYGALLDTNDAIYGGFKATAPVIVFDADQVIPKDIYRTDMNSKAASTAILVGRKILGV